MWVDPNCRRQGIATNLFHLARKYTVSGYWAPAQEVAFSQAWLVSSPLLHWPGHFLSEKND